MDDIVLLLQSTSTTLHAGGEDHAALLFEPRRPYEQVPDPIPLSSSIVTKGMPLALPSLCTTTRSVSIGTRSTCGSVNSGAWL